LSSNDAACFEVQTHPTLFAITTTALSAIPRSEQRPEHVDAESFAT
jgi:hypothetical protein